MNRSRFAYVAPLFVIVLLFGITIDKIWFHLPSGDPKPYHEKVRRAAEELPYQIDDWIGTDAEVSQAAVTMLRPNVLLSRQFKNIRTGQSISFLVVQCGDARDLLGHYPPVCYRASGWTLQSTTPRNWEFESFVVRGMEYEFSKSTFNQASSIIIENFMLLPDGTAAPDMDSISYVAQDPRKKLFGAAQFQLVFDGATSPDMRNEIFELFITAHLPFIRTIGSGEKSES